MHNFVCFRRLPSTYLSLTKICDGWCLGAKYLAKNTSGTLTPSDISLRLPYPLPTIITLHEWIICDEFLMSRFSVTPSHHLSFTLSSETGLLGDSTIWKWTELNGQAEDGWASKQCMRTHPPGAWHPPLSSIGPLKTAQMHKPALHYGQKEDRLTEDHLLGKELPFYHQIKQKTTTCPPSANLISKN